MKFDHPVLRPEVVEHLYEVSLESAAYGSNDGPVGSFLGFDLDPEDPLQAEASEKLHATHLIVRENSDGILTIIPFATQALSYPLHRQLLNAAAQYEAEITDEELREAIDGYRQAALFTAEQTWDDADVPSWSEDAQTQIINDVTDFVVDNVEDIREFLKVTGFPWLQVGIDFSLTRNHEGAGFWDRGVGEVGIVLTGASQAWDSVTVLLGDTGELEIV